MSKSSIKLYYRKDNTTYSIDLYTTLADIGNPAHYLALNNNGTTLYCLADTISNDSLNSRLRFYKNGVTYYVKYTTNAVSIQAGTYTQANFVSLVRNFIANNAIRSLANPVSLEIRTTSGSITTYGYRRNITQFKRLDSSGWSIGSAYAFPIIFHNGQYSSDNTTWYNCNDITTNTLGSGFQNTVSSTSGFNVILKNDIIFI